MDLKPGINGCVTLNSCEKKPGFEVNQNPANMDH